MSSSVYDPRSFEFVARMARIIPARAAETTDITTPLTSADITTHLTRAEHIPIIFQIPDPPQQELVSIPLGRNMRAAPLTATPEYNPDMLDDYIEDLPEHQCSARSSQSDTNNQRREKLQRMINARNDNSASQELHYQAQQLVNEALLQTELKKAYERDEMLSQLMTTFRKDDEASQNVDPALIFERHRRREPDDEMKRYIREELERLMPVVQETST